MALEEGLDAVGAGTEGVDVPGGDLHPARLSKGADTVGSAPQRHQSSWIVTGVVRLWRLRSQMPSSFSATSAGMSLPSR